MTTTTFGTLGVPFPLVEVLAAQGKTTAFPIQVATLPDTLAGRDVLGRGRTGSGKTLAFGIPMVARLGTRLAGGPRRPGRPLGLVLAPTRELATQIAATIAPLAKAYGLTVTTIFGGVSQNPQVAALRSGVDIVVACPGRLEDLMKQKHVFLDAIEITVLDEADHMADLGFLPVVRRLMDATPRDGQRMLFSATLDGGVDVLVKRFLHSGRSGFYLAVVREGAVASGDALEFVKRDEHTVAVADITALYTSDKANESLRLINTDHLSRSVGPCRESGNPRTTPPPPSPRAPRRMVRLRWHAGMVRSRAVARATVGGRTRWSVMGAEQMQM